MAGQCEVCGRTLKTGRKYCYQHKSETYNRSRRSRFSKQDEILLMKAFVFMLLGSAAFAALYFASLFVMAHWMGFLIACGLIVLGAAYRLGKVGVQGLNTFEIILYGAALIILILIIVWKFNTVSSSQEIPLNSSGS